MRHAARLSIRGVVQGVGFRPFLHRLATEYALAGWVRNESGQVELQVEGERSALDAFAIAIPQRLPELARIDALVIAHAEVSGTDTFQILASDSRANPPRLARLPVPADVVMCNACAAEINDPTNRRYRYPFTTCTDCGPRYTVIDSVPYDRAHTSLRAFPLCEACRLEYESPRDRRFHAESIACPVCGPHLSFERTDGSAAVLHNNEGALCAAADVLSRGGIVALRGLGGFHLAVDATNADAVARLRIRKHRAAKPLACMVSSLAEAEQWVELTAPERAWLTSRERPIVLVRLRDAQERASGPAQRLAPAIAPGLDHVGIMLASTPLHALLLELVGGPLVMTSGNLAEEPLSATNDEARTHLAEIADALLLHDREIVARIDDSVVRLAGEVPILMRRARGYAPLPLAVPVTSPVPLLAVGAHLKNTFTLVHAAQAFVSPHVGDLESLEALTHWHAMRSRYEALFDLTPRAVVADLHDGYLSTRVAAKLARAGIGLPLIRVQHHHAHIAAVAAEHGVTDGVLGVAFDGTGAGTDGTVWGCEFLVSDLTGFARVGHLRPFPLPGGDAAVRAPWRSLAGLRSLDATAFARFAQAVSGVSETEQRLVARQIDRSINTPFTSSAGRLFDAVASLLDICHVAAFEGEAAMRLEACAGARPGVLLPFPVVTTSGGVQQLDPVPLLLALYERRANGVPTAQVAADFHDSLVQGTFRLVTELAETYSMDTIALGGGCFQNARLLRSLSEAASAAGLRVLCARLLPANDGGVSYGQAAVAAACLTAKLDGPVVRVEQVVHVGDDRRVVFSH